MKKLVQEKQKAIKMRQKGFSYSEIMKEVPVAKSSLSLWLKDLPLSKDEKKVLKQRKDSNISRGRMKAASELRKRRLEREKQWFCEAQEVFLKNKHNPLFHSGISLFWAEGTKRGNQWQFSNSDVEMIEVILRWLEKFVGGNRLEFKYRIYAHKSYASQDLINWWCSSLKIHKSQFGKITVRDSHFDYQKRVGYKGCFRIEVPKSKGLLCKMKFWKEMVVEYYQDK